MVDDASHRRLADAMRAARAAAGLSQASAASRAGLSMLTWGAVERTARTPSERTLAAIDRALGWPNETAGRILAGARPPSRKALARAADLQQISARLDHIEDLLHAILRCLPTHADGT